jgi:hypothetical protein
MELLNGEPLKIWWERQHGSHEVFRVVAGVTAGVSAMHDAGLVHGDLHPENVMVLADGTPKLIDWRYQDTFLQRSSSHRRDEIGNERRRTIDLIITLLENQSFVDESLAVRRMQDLKEIVSTLQHALAPAATTATRASTAPTLTAAEADAGEGAGARGGRVVAMLGELKRIVFSSSTDNSADDVYETVRIDGDRAVKHAPGEVDDGELVAERQQDGTWRNVISGMTGSLNALRR